ncbi:hypothetical protein NDU88_004054 [Pleurodeles waltl]|uniref:Uncharacterized protein n=1 Tax=Pleurodeles waltl TaxID=8319 RepID=A0AAV7V458_PLEWA|nr:hypothetical protein NDU88_004054 [Pleurodeles waltl]
MSGLGVRGVGPPRRGAVGVDIGGPADHSGTKWRAERCAALWLVRPDEPLGRFLPGAAEWYARDGERDYGHWDDTCGLSLY